MDNEKKKVCIISTSRILSKLLVGEKLDQVGGAEVQLVLIADMLVGDGYEVTFLIHDLGQPDEIQAKEGVRLIKAYAKKRSPANALMPWKHPFWRAMKKADADIYFQYTSGTMSGVLCILSKLMRKPYVHATSIDLDLDGTKEKGLNPIRRMIYRYGMKHSDAIVVLTEYQNRLLRRRFGRDGFIIQILTPDVEFTPDVKRESILWVGSFRKHKRPEMFMDLAERLPQHEFLMVGGPFREHPELYDEMKKRAEGIDNLTFAGVVQRDAVGEYFNASKLFVCTSTMEGFPVTFIEAWKTGLPVITTFDPDGVVARKELGCHCRDFEELVHAVDAFASDDGFLRRVGDKARVYVDENHSRKAVSARYRELFGGILKK